MASVSTTVLDRIRTAVELRTPNGEPISVARWIRLWLSWGWYETRVFFARRWVRSGCPACGYRRKHSIEWNPNARTRGGDRGMLIHTCAVCKAMWSASPIVAAKHWRVPDITSEFDLETAIPPNHESLPPLEVVA